MSQLVLIGYRGTGKTTVAQLLALRIGWDWVDLDVEIELAAGTSIAEIFAQGGEPRFRRLESEALVQVAARQRLVLATGGGIVLDPANRKQLAQLGTVVWLQARPETIADRLAEDPTSAGRRPNLTAAGGLEEIRQLLTAREPLYRGCAQLTVETDDKSPEAVADEVLQDWSPDPLPS